MPVSSIVAIETVYCIFVNLCSRHVHKANSTHTVASFGLTTSTSNLRKHLYSEHVEEWVAACDDLKIKITARAALPVVQKFRTEPDATPLESERQEFTKEAFVEAVLEFIVGDDQVSMGIYN
jgi:hypothetical protein